MQHIELGGVWCGDPISPSDERDSTSAPRRRERLPAKGQVLGTKYHSKICTSRTTSFLNAKILGPRSYCRSHAYSVISDIPCCFPSKCRAKRFPGSIYTRPCNSQVMYSQLLNLHGGITAKPGFSNEIWRLASGRSSVSIAP